MGFEIKKYYFRVLAIIAMSGLFCGCVNDTTTTPDKLEITPMSLSFSEISEHKTIHILSSGSWSIVVPEKWCTFSKTSGNGNASVVISVTANTSGVSRMIKVPVKVGQLSQEITIMQRANVEAYSEADIAAQKLSGFYLRKNKTETFVYNADTHQMAVNGKAQTYRIQTYNQDTVASVLLSTLPKSVGSSVTVTIDYMISNQKDTTMYSDATVIKIESNKVWLYDHEYGRGVVIDNLLVP